MKPTAAPGQHAAGRPFCRPQPLDEPGGPRLGSEFRQEGLVGRRQRAVAPSAGVEDPRATPLSVRLHVGSTMRIPLRSCRGPFLNENAAAHSSPRASAEDRRRSKANASTAPGLVNGAYWIMPRSCSETAAKLSLWSRQSMNSVMSPLMDA